LTIICGWCDSIHCSYETIFSQQPYHRATNLHHVVSSARTNTSPTQLTQAYSFLTQYIHIQTTDYPWQSGGKELYNGLIAQPTNKSKQKYMHMIHALLQHDCFLAPVFIEDRHRYTSTTSAAATATFVVTDQDEHEHEHDVSIQDWDMSKVFLDSPPHPTTTSSSSPSDVHQSSSLEDTTTTISNSNNAMNTSPNATANYNHNNKHNNYNNNNYNINSNSNTIPTRRPVGRP